MTIIIMESSRNPVLMPDYCTYKNLHKYINPLNDIFLTNRDVIQNVFSVIVRSNSDSLKNVTKSSAKSKLYTIPFHSLALRSSSILPKWAGDPGSYPGIHIHRNSVNINSLEPNKLFVVFVTVRFSTGKGHAGAGIVHKHNDIIEYFILEPHGIAYDYHVQIALILFKADDVYIPFAKVQNSNKLCIAHSYALLFKFLKSYKQKGNMYLEKIRESRFIFSRPPILNMGGPLGRSQTGRITNSIDLNKKSPKSRPKAFGMSRARVEPKEPENSPETELFWLWLRARNRGMRNNVALVKNARNTSHFKNYSEQNIVKIVNDYNNKKSRI